MICDYCKLYDGSYGGTITIKVIQVYGEGRESHTSYNRYCSKECMIAHITIKYKEEDHPHVTK